MYLSQRTQLVNHRLQYNVAIDPATEAAMAINEIQMQAGMSLAQLLERYGTEAQCEATLIRARWPHGFACPRCGHTHCSRFRRAGTLYWQCAGCRYQCSLRSGTMMEHSRLPLRSWYLAIYLVTQSKTNMAALELRRHLGVSWRTAWLLKHKLMEAMRQRESTRALSDDVRIDDAYLGGERTGGRPGRASENKVPFVAAVQMHEGRPIRVRFDRVESFSFAALRPWAAQALAPGCHVISDGLLGFEVLASLGHTHQPVIAPRGKAGTEIEPFRWLNIVLGNLKTAISGTHHAFGFRKYAHRYLAEVAYRFNRRFDLAALVPRLAVALMRATPCTRGAIQMPAEICT